MLRAGLSLQVLERPAAARFRWLNVFVATSHSHYSTARTQQLQQQQQQLQHKHQQPQQRTSAPRRKRQSEGHFQSQFETPDKPYDRRSRNHAKNSKSKKYDYKKRYMYPRGKLIQARLNSCILGAHWRPIVASQIGENVPPTAEASLILTQFFDEFGSKGNETTTKGIADKYTEELRSRFAAIWPPRVGSVVDIVGNRGKRRPAVVAGQPDMLKLTIPVLIMANTAAKARSTVPVAGTAANLRTASSSSTPVEETATARPSGSATEKTDWRDQVDLRYSGSDHIENSFVLTSEGSSAETDNTPTASSAASDVRLLQVPLVWITGVVEAVPPEGAQGVDGIPLPPFPGLTENLNMAWATARDAALSLEREWLGQDIGDPLLSEVRIAALHSALEAWALSNTGAAATDLKELHESILATPDGAVFIKEFETNFYETFARVVSAGRIHDAVAVNADDKDHLVWTNYVSAAITRAEEFEAQVRSAQIRLQRDTNALDELRRQAVAFPPESRAISTEIAARFLFEGMSLEGEEKRRVLEREHADSNSSHLHDAFRHPSPLEMRVASTLLFQSIGKWFHILDTDTFFPTDDETFVARTATVKSIMGVRGAGAKFAGSLLRIFGPRSLQVLDGVEATSPPTEAALQVGRWESFDPTRITPSSRREFWLQYSTRESVMKPLVSKRLEHLRGNDDCSSGENESVESPSLRGAASRFSMPAISSDSFLPLEGRDFAAFIEELHEMAFSPLAAGGTLTFQGLRISMDALRPLGFHGESREQASTLLRWLGCTSHKDNKALQRTSMGSAPYLKKQADVFASPRAVGAAILSVQTMPEREWFGGFGDHSRSLPVLAIDSASTVEVDDAVSVERVSKGEGLSETWVHIHVADVARFVEANSALDLEARARATSVYLPSGATHMLPWDVGVKLLSLEHGRMSPGAPVSEGIPAITWSVCLDARGEISDFRIARTRLDHVRRISYEDVDRILAGEIEETERISSDGLVAEALIELSRISELRTQLRRQNGSLSELFPREELAFLDAQLVLKAQDTPARRLVEELMVTTSEASSRYADMHGLPVAYRVQTYSPLSVQLERLSSSGTNPLAEDLLAMWRSDWEEQPESEWIGSDSPFWQHWHTVLTRSAATTYECRPHASLGLEGYTRVTSPLRRYADLLFHHQLSAFLSGHPLPFSEKDVQRIAPHLNHVEVSARNLQRNVLKDMVLKQISARGEDHAAIIVQHERGSNRARVVLPAFRIALSCDLATDGSSTGSRTRLGEPLTARFDPSRTGRLREVVATTL